MVVEEKDMQKTGIYNAYWEDNLSHICTSNDTLGVPYQPTQHLLPSSYDTQ